MSGMANRVMHLLKQKYFIARYFLSNDFHSSTKIYSQPTPLSHPHLLRNNEVTHKLNIDVYRNRKQKLVNVIHSKDSRACAHLVVIPSASILYMSESIPYPFRQNTDFFYLCGFKEPNCVLVLSCGPGKASHHQSILFIPNQSAHSKKWEGPKMEPENVSEFLGINECLHVTDFEKYLQSFTKTYKQFTIWYDYLNTTSRPMHGSMQEFVSSFSGRFSVESPQAALHQTRLIKSPEEVGLMRETCRIGAEALTETMKFSRPFVPESHLQAKMDYECRLRGADHLAFPPVVAGGDRANTIHYIDNNNIVDDCEMVLMDAGCEYHGYNSDITRTWPVSGKFTDAQKELYGLLLQLQEELIRMCNPDLSLDKLLDIMCRKLGSALQGVGVIPSSVSESQLADAAYDFCPHHVGHYLGMDVHDTNLISRNIQLQPGMVVTVEPGIYIPRNLSSCPERYRGLCIRIEDDILITDKGNEVLTSACPKHIDQIEQLFK